ncbi:Peptidoglycan/LPS O-acetylase OafA/YrhL, contains acyltransferase and SGNH-hydrolase domains [Paenibacillus sp. yr247]|uniref:acyltransferase n=1 Tax=Paenibacillus sp. yr247 TaxID=1761880 RepID=UPI0008886AFB|nr:acyltransferase [Paenibacillus sp. yr247]SDN18262.1 Peptidoglycan/LPS O-acetylase OafA/YrhL, contains acyltransferase and SGNH-hydrolase domains [Paenibacillus sp. yr247]
MLSRPKLLEIDIVRAIAIIAVLVIHGTSGATQLPLGTSSQAVFFILNKANLFTVPLFIWISGVVLFYTYYDRWEPGMSRLFWTKRLRRILIPYVLWSIFYYLYNQFMFHGKISFDAMYVIKLLLSGNASYHLYYMVIIVQFYLLFPLLITAARKSPWVRQGLIPLGIGMQAAAYSIHHWVHPLPEYASLFLSYSALFAFGAFVGIHYAAIVAWSNRHKSWIWSIMCLAGITFVGMLLLHQYGLAFIENTWFELSLLVYCITIPLCCIQWARQRLASGSQLGTALSALGAASFGIYLVHPAILTLWDLIAPAQEQLWLYDLHTVASILIGLLGSWLLVRLYASAQRKGSAN